MTRPRPKPWHEVVRLKDELRSGELSLAEFAADLHEVTLGRGKRPVYEEPDKFFALTYPTHALRELVRDVAARLAGRSDKAVRQLELTYGGGKTHTLIALYHLFRESGGSAGRAGGERVSAARGSPVAGSSRSGALLRQDRCRARHRRSAFSRGRDPRSSAPVERARVSACRR